MGAAHSNEPRSVSMDNTTPLGVIDVSQDVVKRITRNMKQQAKEKASASASPPLLSSKEETRAVPIKPTPAVKPAAASAPAVVYQNPHTIYVPAPGATMSALEMQRQKESELQRNDEMWRQRMAALEQTLNKTNAVMEQEYSAAVDDVRKRFATASPIHQLPPCQDLKSQVIACYRANPGETLKCAEEVAAFRNCVSENRIRKLDSEQEKSTVPTAAVKAVKAG